MLTKKRSEVIELLGHDWELSPEFPLQTRKRYWVIASTIVTFDDQDYCVEIVGANNGFGFSINGHFPRDVLYMQPDHAAFASLHAFGQAGFNPVQCHCAYRLEDGKRLSHYICLETYGN